MNEPMRILILEDNPADAELVQFELEEAGLVFTSKVVVTERDFIRELQEICPDLILSDYDPPKYNGALALAEAKRRCPDTPFVLVTGAVTEDRAIDILTQGAKDYVLKNRLQQRLVPAVRRALAEAEEHKERKKAEEDLRAASLYSRTLIEASLDPFVTISPEGKVMDVNKATEEITGCSREQIIGNDFSDYFAEPEKARAGYKKAFLQGSVKDYPLAIRHTTGRVTEVLYNATVYKNKKGEVQGVFAAARDVTDLKEAEAKIHEAHRTLDARVKTRTAELETEVAARKRAEEALKESDERQRFALEISHIGAWDLDLTDHSAFRSLEHDRIFGYAEPLPHWTYEMFLEHVLPEDRMSVDQQFQRAIENHGDWNFECRIRRADGEVRWICAAGRHKLNAGGEARQMAGIVQDITERKRADEALKESENRLRRLYESGLLGAIFWNMDGEITDANDKFLKMVGYGREDLAAGRIDWSRMTPPEYRHLDENSMAELKATGINEKPFEKEYIRKDGTRVPVIVAGAMLDEARFGGVAFVLDNSESKRMEKVQAFLAQTGSGPTDEPFFNALARYLAENLGMDFVCIDRLEGDGLMARTVAVWCDGRFEDNVTYALKDTPCGEVVGKTVCCFPASVCQFFPRDQVLRDLRAESYVGVTLFGYTGKPIGLIAVIGRGALANRTLAEAVLKLVAVRAAGEMERQDAEKALHDRSVQLEDANRELESFSYSVSHDLKAPLRAIDGYFRMFLKKYGGALDPDASRMIGVIHSNTDKMRVLIDDLLSFSRVLNNSMSLSEIDMERLAGEVWNELREANRERELEVRITNLPSGFGDRALIRQVFANLLSNAVKFTRNRRPGLIEISGSYAEPGKVVYCVKDNGVGFDMAYYNKLFGVFHRLHRDEEYEGSGVGLAIVQRIIHRHGGRVWAEGKPDEGATFSFTLPQKEDR